MRGTALRSCTARSPQVLDGYHYSHLRSTVVYSTRMHVIRPVETPTMVKR
jgi:hypothetical protein